MARLVNQMRSSSLRGKEPFDLPLSLRAASSFSRGPVQPESTLRIPARMNREPVIIEVRQTKKHPPILEVSYPSDIGSWAVQITSYVLNVDLDLRPFYRVAASDRRMAPVTKALRGLRPLRPSSLFEMLVTAITEQQISLRLAYLMREKMTARFGDKVEETPVFPDESSLSRAPLAALVGCGLSHRKAEYIRDLSRMVADGRLDLEKVKEMGDDEASATLTQVRGIGPWTAEYVLVRGLGRTDRVPVEDVGVRDVVGRYLGSGDRIGDPRKVLPLLRPFIPFRGLAVFYLLVYDRLNRSRARGAQA
jgi:DNA-3-methyladenine glycosylase II